MKETQPRVRLIAMPYLDWDELAEYVNSIGGGRWVTRMRERMFSPEQRKDGTDAEILVEAAGRSCYRSWDTGLNPNITKVREESSGYLQNVLKSGHGSVLEHANFTFIFQDVSRVFTHELVRHRAGVAVSQESLRYVRLTDIGFRIPPILQAGREEVITIVEMLETFQKKAGALLDNPDIPFAAKKEVTSALRRLAPLGLSTTIIWTANVRALRHVISMRTAKGAEEEIRSVFQTVAAKMKEVCPLLFGDYETNIDGEYITPYWKV